MSGQRKILDSLSPVVGGVGGRVRAPSWGVWEWGFASVQVCSSPNASLSPSVGLCVLLSVSKRACGGARVYWLAAPLSLSPWPLPPFLQ